ncbi:MAG: ATP-binding cassette domain-containing protein [Bacilli bacterium]
MTILKTHDLSKRYKTYFALDKVNMTIEEGDIYGFVGENGAGKTTLIRAITGLISIYGNYELFGVSSKDEKIFEKRKLVSSIVEAASINKSMTAKENIILQSLAYGIKITDEEISSLLSKVGLDEKSIEKKKTKDFSLGMRQRLGIAICLINNPKFIILDEPMNGLDPSGFIEIRELILNLASQGITFLISSHILGELDKICNKVGFLSHGKLLEEISMEELHNKTRSNIKITMKKITDINEELIKKLQIQDYRIEGNSLLVFDKVDINNILKIIVDDGIQLEAISNSNESIEDYYFKIMREAQ